MALWWLKTKSQDTIAWAHAAVMPDVIRRPQTEEEQRMRTGKDRSPGRRHGAARAEAVPMSADYGRGSNGRMLRELAGVGLLHFHA